MTTMNKNIANQFKFANSERKFDHTHKQALLRKQKGKHRATTEAIDLPKRRQATTNLIGMSSPI